MYGLDYPSMGTSPITRIESAIYGGFYKLAWSVAVGWVIFSSCRGYGGKNFIKICFILAWRDKSCMVETEITLKYQLLKNKLQYFSK